MSRFLLALSFTPSLAIADEPQRKPFEEGTWVAYHVDVHVKSTELNSQNTATFTVKVLEHEVVDGNPCRWLEFKSPDPPESFRVAKLLVRETHLLGESSENPIVKGFVRRDDGPVTKFDASMVTFIQSELGLAVLASGKLTDEGSRESPRELDYERGKLRVSRATTGKGVLPKPRFPLDYAIDYTTWRHEDVPLGVGAQTTVIRADFPDGGEYEMTVDLALQDFGTGAKAEIAEK